MLTENMQGIVVEASTGARLHENQVRGSWVSGIAVQDLPTKTVDEVPPPLPSHEISGNTIEMGLDSKSTGIDLRGSPVRFMSGVSGAPTNGLPPLTVHDNVVSGGGNAVTLASVADAEIRRNDLDDPVRGLLILDDGWPNRFYHNNVTATDVGVTDGRTQGGECNAEVGSRRVDENVRVRGKGCNSPLIHCIHLEGSCFVTEFGGCSFGGFHVPAGD